MAETEVQLSEQAKATVPAHIAIVMDGNGRWAKKRRLPRVQGHRKGVDSVRIVVRAAGEIGVKYLTLYAFSVENWNRPKSEVDTLMKYLSQYLASESRELDQNNVRLATIGQIHRLPEFAQEQIARTRSALAKNTGLTLILALSYGGRAEIVEACREIAAKVKSGDILPEEIDEPMIARHLYTRNIPDPDLLIRTSGEMRLSNYLLWQISYAELVVTSTLWPDFHKAQFFAALEEYTRRHRRFGRI